jgi:plasmid replication initiation protein
MNKKYLVTKSNKLISASYDLSLQEQRIILVLSSLVQLEDKEFKEYIFKIPEFAKLLELKDKDIYRKIKNITKSLMKKVFEIQVGKNKCIQLAWLCSAIYLKNEGTVSLKFSPDLKPYLLELKSFYTKYRLENILKLKSKYSIRIYEILKSNAFKNQISIELDELKKMIGANARYLKVYSDFKKNVLLLTQREINLNTDIKFEFEEVRVRRSIKEIRFIIEKIDSNTNNTIKYIDESKETEIDDLAFKIKKEIEDTVKGQISLKKVFELLDKKGSDKIFYYIKNFNKYKNSKHNSIGFFIKAVEDEYPIPKEDIINYNNKPIQSTNFDQREYDDDFFDSLYDNFKE